MGKSEYSFTWKIENFPFCVKENGHRLESPRFNFGEGNYKLFLYPRGDEVENAGYISCFLRLSADVLLYDTFDLCGSEIKIFGGSGKTLKVLTFDKMAYEYDDEGEWLMWGSSEFVAVEEVIQDAESSAEDILTVCCTLYSTKAIENISDQLIVHTKIGVDQLSFISKVIFGSDGFCVTENFKQKCGSFKFSLTRNENDSDGKLEMTVVRQDLENKGPCFIDCKLRLLNHENREICSDRFKHFFHRENPSSNWEFHSKFLTDILKENDFFIFIHVEFFCSNGTALNFPSIGHYHPSLLTFSINYPPQHEDLRESSDVTLQVDCQIFEAHKNILAARSPVFAAMFDQNMIENTMGIIELDDIDADTFKLFLQFLYTDTVDEMTYEDAINLMKAAEKYQVLSLKEKCLICLKREMSVESACEILSLADGINHVDLKSASMDFIIANSANILSSPKWTTWMENNMKLTSAIFLKLTLSLSSPETDVSCEKGI